MVKVAIYTRVSTDDQAEEGYSLDAQKERLEAYCEAQGWDVVRIYVDDGYSGRTCKRPAYQRMMQERDEWDVILVLKMDRITPQLQEFHDDDGGSGEVGEEVYIHAGGAGHIFCHGALCG